MNAKTLSRRKMLTAGAVGAAASTLPAPAVLAQEKIRWRVQSHWTPGVEYFDTVYQELAR